MIESDMFRASEMLITPSTTYLEFQKYSGIKRRTGDTFDEFNNLKKKYKYVLIDSSLYIRVTENWNKERKIYLKNSGYKIEQELLNHFVKKIRTLKLNSI